MVNRINGAVPNTPRTISQIAAEIYADWRPINYAAEPYLRAMRELNTMQDSYGFDSAPDIVLRFLGNAKAWRGETARRLKAELRAMLP